MRGAPQSGFSRLILRISWRTSAGTAGRPGCRRRTFQSPNKRKPLRCQPTAVSGLTMTGAERQSRQTWASQAQKKRSVAVNFGRFTERCITVSRCRRARTSI